MSDKKLFIPILLGTVRHGRESEKVARWLLSRVAAHPDIETRLFDPRDMHLPMNDEGEDLKEKNFQWRDAIIRADGLIIVSPEYNHGYPGSLKRALDILLQEYVHKAVGLVGVSSGILGGARVIEQLAHVVRELGLTVTFTDMIFPQVQDLFNEDGTMKDEEGFGRRADRFLIELVWMARTLRWGRENISSIYHRK